MLGAIAGDVIGSVYEGANVKSPDFQPLFHPDAQPTDDSILTCAIAEWILRGAGDDLVDRLHNWFAAFPLAGYGMTFIRWAGYKHREPYHSWGNGSAMRVSAVGHAFDTLEETLKQAERSAAVTHNHPHGIAGAKSVAACIFLARTGAAKSEIRDYIVRRFGYDLSRSLDDIRPDYSFDVSCQGSVPEAIIAALESTTWEDAVRKAISLGGDSDTIAAIAGSIAAPMYGGVPKDIRTEVEARLPESARIILTEFLSAYPSAR
jgi:ADP-ribosylglycohydrolase